MLDWNDRSPWVWVLPDQSLIEARELGRSVLVLVTKMLVTEMVWIGACDEDGVDLDQE